MIDVMHQLPLQLFFQVVMIQEKPIQVKMQSLDPVNIQHKQDLPNVNIQA